MKTHTRMSLTALQFPAELLQAQITNADLTL